MLQSHLPTRRARVRALVALTSAAALAAGSLAVAPAALAGTPGTSAAIYGTSDATYDGVYRQSLAILGLHAADIAPDPVAVQWLLDQQCSNGGFTSFDDDTSSRCTNADGIDSNATSLAVLALDAVGKSTQAQTGAALLEGSRQPDGGWEYTLGSGWGTDPNSTALVTLALIGTGRTPDAGVAPYFASYQTGRTGVVVHNATEDDAGAIANSLADADWAGPDVLATNQSVPALNGLTLDAISAPSEWAAEAAEYPTEPSASAADIAGWASTWLAAKVVADEVSPSNLAWTVLSLASNGTAKDQAEVAYERLRARTLDISANPGALGQAILAATVLGESADAAKFAALLENTLTDPIKTPLPPKPDTSAPTVAVTVPGAARSVDAWRTLRGTSGDKASGVKSVIVRAVQKRDGDWFAYVNGAWRKKASLAKANTAATPVVVTPKASGAWSTPLKALRKGRLKVHVRALDNAGNRSAVSTTTRELTRR